MKNRERLFYITTILFLVVALVFSSATPATGGVWSGTGILATGQTTSYSGELDDGHYEAGIAKSYTVYTTGQFASTSNIDLIHFTDTDVAFADSDPDTITSTGTDLDGLFVVGDDIVITGDSDNNGVYEIDVVAGKVITLTVGGALSTEAAGDSVSIAKREALSNNTVLDNNTGLMWARYTSAENAAMGAASDGKMPWTGELYDIFQWAAAANVAGLGGYDDWRIPDDTEMLSLRNMEASSAVPDSTAFPSWSLDYFWSSTSSPGPTTRAMRVRYDAGSNEDVDKATACAVALVRGGA